MKRLLLISNSTMHGRTYLEHCREDLRAFLGGLDRLLFVPWALHDLDAYAAKARMFYESLGVAVESIHEAADPVAAVEGAEGMFVGGGNTWRLLDRLQRAGVVPAIRRRVEGGMRYIGSSAGTGISAPTIKTTNDMPIVQPQSFESLGLVPFQFNCHYLDPDPGSTHMGETRETRIREFHEMNDTPVVGLREGTWVLVEGGRAELRGVGGARIFRRGVDAVEAPAGTELGQYV